MKCTMLITIAVAALAGSGCGDGNSDRGSAASNSSNGSPQGKVRLAANAKPAASGVAIKTRDSQFGKVLFSKSNRAIYYFAKESGKRPKCYGACAEAWPPVLTSGAPRASGAVKEGLLGTTQRRNGKKQVTYKGHPLYFYVDDPRKEVLCHNVEEFGGLWLAVKPNGASPP